ncbi:MAG: histidinol-phosphate aminotransferase family protein [Lachnospiraceae bacterium]|nr:histidinol-phosphate aminotransferase family protein [Lachnospiraceae bacterium]
MIHGGDIYRNKVNMDFSVNLNPLGTPEEILQAARESLNKAGCYPDPYQEEIRALIGNHVGLSKECVFAGCGASQLIDAATAAVHPGRVLFFEPSFPGYEHATRMQQARIRRRPLSSENGFHLTEEDLSFIDDGVDLVYVCDPANPTGVNVDGDILETLLVRAKEAEAFVILDESFYPLSEKATGDPNGAASLVKRFDNLYLIRSMTKHFAAPGLRFGYVLSHPENIEKLRAMLPEWNLPTTSEAALKAGIWLLEESDFAARSLDTIRREREYLTEALRDAGLTVFDSDTSFLFLHASFDLKEALLQREILIRDFKEPYPMPGYFRIAVKDHASNEVLVGMIKEITDAL